MRCGHSRQDLTEQVAFERGFAPSLVGKRSLDGYLQKVLVFLSPTVSSAALIVYF